MRQHIDHKHFYDRTKLTLKVIHKTQYVAAMNPTAGSFHIQDRLQRHFCTLALSFPDESAVQTIFSTILSQHFRNNGMPSSVVKIVSDLVTAAIAIHSKITSTFLPTAVCFHYVFNLRDLSNIFQVSSICYTSYLVITDFSSKLLISLIKLGQFKNSEKPIARKIYLKRRDPLGKGS